MAAFSTRSAEIEAALAERGTSRDAASAVEKQIAALDTREAKVAADHVSLVTQWRETASGAGFGPAARLAMIEQAEAQAATPSHPLCLDAPHRERVVAGKRGDVSVDIGCRRQTQ